MKHERRSKTCLNLNLVTIHIMASSAAGYRRLTRRDVEKACDPKEYGDKSKYPYINYLPFTKISDRAQEYDTFMNNGKQNPPPKPLTMYQTRQAMLDSGFEAKNDINEPNSTLIIKKSINVNSKICSDLTNINYYRVSYRGASIKNGIIIMVHGGGYCTKSPLRTFSFAEAVSKITGCIMMCLNYKLSPEYKCSYSISEVVEFYRSIVTNPSFKNVPIALEGS